MGGNSPLICVLHLHEQYLWILNFSSLIIIKTLIFPYWFILIITFIHLTYIENIVYFINIWKLFNIYLDINLHKFVDILNKMITFIYN